MKNQTVTHEEFMSMVRELAKTNVVVAAMLKKSDDPDDWPDHLREDLFRRMKLVPKKVYEVQ